MPETTFTKIKTVTPRAIQSVYSNAFPIPIVGFSSRFFIDDNGLCILSLETFLNIDNPDKHLSVRIPYQSDYRFNATLTELSKQTDTKLIALFRNIVSDAFGGFGIAIHSKLRDMNFKDYEIPSTELNLLPAEILNHLRGLNF